jgi:hypothetical protein
MRTFQIVIILLFSVNGLLAQSTDKLEKQELEKFDNAFDEFKESQSEGYNAFVDQIDKNFADFLRKNWVEFEVHSGHNIEEKPKPETFPEANDEPIESEQLELSTPDDIVLEEALIMPINYKESTYEDAPKFSQFDFYGDYITLKYVPGFNDEINPAVNPETIAQFWEGISDVDYRLSINDLLFYKDKYALNDYGYYLLLKKFSESITVDKNHSVLMTWYLMAKSKYKAKIGYNSESIFLLLPSKTQVYGTSFFKFDGLTYYVIDFSGGKLLTYKDNYELAYRTINFAISETLKLKAAVEKRHIEFTFQNQAYDFDFEYNVNAIDFYKEFPQIELKDYFNSSITQSASNSIIQNLKPIVDEMDEMEAANFLLSLVQNGFAYKIDDIQFGKEKAFFAEEILHYPFSDCEDRSVFFAYLVSTLLGNEVVGLDYPKHVAAAVKFNEDYPGDFYMFNNDKYIVCDPTYINAPVGVSMKDFSATKAELIIREKNIIVSDDIVGRMMQTFGLQGNLEMPKVITVNKGKIIASNYNGNISVKDKEINGTQKSFFTAKFNEDNQLLWIKNAGGEASLIDVLNTNNQTYLLYNSQLNGIKSNILVKMDEKGNLLWKNTILPMKPKYDNANIQVTLFDFSGKKIAGKTYAESEFYESKKLSLRRDKLLVVLPISK